MHFTWLPLTFDSTTFVGQACLIEVLHLLQSVARPPQPL